MRRALVDRVWSQREQIKGLRAIPFADSDDSPHLGARASADNIAARAAALELHGRECGLLKPGENAASSRQLIRMTEELLSASILGESVAPVAYRSLSGIAHVNPLAVLSTFPRRSEGFDEREGQYVMFLRDPQRLAGPLMMALAACESLVSSLTRSTGRPFELELLQEAYILVLGLSR